MADFQQTMDVPGGKVSIAMKGGVVSTRIEKGDVKFEEKTTALPNHKDIFNKLGANDKLEKGDIIVFSYKNGPGYAEVVTSSDGTSVKAVGPKGDERSRDHLLANSTYDASTGTFTYKGSWDSRYEGMTFQIIRSKNGTPPAQTRTTPDEGANDNRGGGTSGNERGQDGAKSKLTKQKEEFDRHLTEGMNEYHSLYSKVESRRSALAKTDPSKTFSTWDQGSATYKRAEREWNADGKVKLQALEQEQNGLKERYKTFEKDLREAQTYDKKETVVTGLRSFVQTKSRSYSSDK